MKGDTIKFYRGYKYQLAADYTVQTGVTRFLVSHEYFHLCTSGLLTIHEGYAWDGASGPTLDTASTMRGSLVHDVFCQMMNLGLLPQSCFHPANRELHTMLLQDGMWRLRARLWFKMVEDWGASYAAVQPEKIYQAP